MTLSEVKPDSGIAENSQERCCIPELLVGTVTRRRDLELLQLVDGGDGWQNLPPLFVSVDHMQHELTSFFLVVEQANECKILGSHILVDRD